MHPAFDRPLVYKEVENPNRKFWQSRWFIHEDFHFIDMDGQHHHIPAGKTDLATMPWPLCLVFPQDGPYKQEAVAHDHWRGVARHKADVLMGDARFYYALYLNPLTSVRQDEVFYGAVRLHARIRQMLCKLKWRPYR